MLNRTNRMLSANLNRLNLGTRSIARVMGANMDRQALAIRHAHPQAMVETARLGTFAATRIPPFGAYPAPSILPSPSPSKSWCVAPRGSRPGVVVVGVPPTTAPAARVRVAIKAA